MNISFRTGIDTLLTLEAIPADLPGAICWKTDLRRADLCTCFTSLSAVFSRPVKGEKRQHRKQRKYCSHRAEEPAKEEKEDVIDIEAKPEITFEDFGKLQFQVGKIIKCEEVKKSKDNPDIYLLSAKKLNITPEECLVFEDIVQAVKGAKLAGMKVYAIHDKSSAHQRDELITLADRYICNYKELL